MQNGPGPVPSCDRVPAMSDDLHRIGENEQPYRRYLFTVRFWRKEPGSQSDWWGRVQSANDGETHTFRDWPGLIAFLTAKLEEIEDDDS